MGSGVDGAQEVRSLHAIGVAASRAGVREEADASLPRRLRRQPERILCEPSDDEAVHGESGRGEPAAERPPAVLQPLQPARQGHQVGVRGQPQQRVAPVRHRDHVPDRRRVVQRQPADRHLHLVRADAVHHRLLQHDPDAQAQRAHQTDSQNHSSHLPAHQAAKCNKPATDGIKCRQVQPAPTQQPHVGELQPTQRQKQLPAAPADAVVVGAEAQQLQRRHVADGQYEVGAGDATSLQRGDGHTTKW